MRTYYCAEGFDTVASACPVPLVMAGGKKLPELEALTMVYRAGPGRGSRLEFVVVGLPLRLPGATGSPWNPIANF